MAEEPFNFDREDLDRLVRNAGDQLRSFFAQFERAGRSGSWSSLFDDAGRRSRPAGDSATTGQTGSGVWAVYTVDGEGGARVEEVYATEVEALRANQHNTDSRRRVRFLPYGIAVSVLDEPDPANPPSADA